MNEKTVKQIPYGITDYGRIRRENFYYVDKTGYLKIIEQAGAYLFFIRPRRFGKSLFLSIMEAYYDVYYRDRFKELFEGTAVYDAPTKERGSYLLLKLNFSMVDPAVERLEKSFLTYIREKGEDFLVKYKENLGMEDAVVSGEIEKINNTGSPSDILRFIARRCKRGMQKLYVIIDEYDNFSNTILSTFGHTRYIELTHGGGFFRTFFNVLKGSTTDMDAPISRLFITGVSPVTMDDVTSGFNIGKNVSIEPGFNEMLGFSEREVVNAVEYYRSEGMVKLETGYLLDVMKTWYDNYLFSKKSDTTLFNSDMILYFMDACLRHSEIPDNLIDRNVRIDYGKLRHLILIDSRGGKEANGNFTKLKEIIDEGEITSKLSLGFPLEEIDSPENFVSLLFYMGLLTIAGEKDGLPLFKIPNQTVKTLYYDYIIRVGNETGLIALNIGKINTLLHAMAYYGDWEGFFAYISERMGVSSGLRDFIREEKVIQGFLLAWLGIADYFIVHSEAEMNRGYADIYMEPFLARYEGIKYSYILEIKYMKKEKGKRTARGVEKLKNEAEQQLKQYAADEKLLKRSGKTRLIKLVLVFSGPELTYIGKVD
ncbi:MAG: AAA family ATPase [bacterium]|nr:AAA family ATPase [bacterium]